MRGLCRSRLSQPRDQAPRKLACLLVAFGTFGLELVETLPEFAYETGTALVERIDGISDSAGAGISMDIRSMSFLLHGTFRGSSRYLIVAKRIEPAKNWGFDACFGRR